MADVQVQPGRSRWPALPGPANRVTFLEAQRRNRRALRGLHVLCALAVVILAVVTGSLLALFAGAGVAFVPHLISIVSSGVPRPVTLTPEVWRVLAVLAVAGTVAVLAYWLIVRSLLRRAGTQAAVSMFRARACESTDFEETQLVNIVEEMAIAAGIQPPRLLLSESESCNIAAFGLTPDEGTIVVSRRMLDTLDRDETQGALAHMIASLGNGDTGAVLAFHAAGHALGLPAMLLAAPFDRSTRQMLLDVLRPRWPGAHPTERDVAAVSMIFTGGRDSSDRSTARAALVAFGAILLLPVLVWLLVVMLVVMLEMLLFVPLAMRTLRRRRLLADSIAVELTRNPDGLARALGRSAAAAGIPAGRWATPWCLVGAGDRTRLFNARIFEAHPDVAARVARLIEQGAAASLAVR